MIEVIKAKKIGMTNVFEGAGTTVPVTLVRPYKMVVTQIKTREKDGYNAIQLAYCETTEKHVNKPILGILKKAGVNKYYRKFYEVKVKEEDIPKFKLGQLIDPSEFLIYWAEVDVTGISKGRGFAGVMKRHGFHGQSRTHGDPDERRPQSSGATDPARVFPGTKKPGHMGNSRVTVKAMSCYEYNKELDVLVLQGSVPGPNGGEVTLKLRKLLSKQEMEDVSREEEEKAERRAEKAEVKAEAESDTKSTQKEAEG